MEHLKQRQLHTQEMQITTEFYVCLWHVFVSGSDVRVRTGSSWLRI